MESGLQIKTRCSPEADAEDEPVSPTGQYFNSKSLSVCILAVLETSVPIDDSGTLPLLRELFLPINPRFSSIMAYDKKGKRRWKKVEVNLQDHVNVPSFPESLSVESYDDNFDKYLTKLTTKILPEDRPLWEIHILKYPTSKAAGHIIFKLHHALGDGYSLMGALLSCLQRADNPSLPLTFPSTKSNKNANKSRAKSFTSCIQNFFSVINGATFDFGWTVFKSACIADDKTPIRSGDKDLACHPVKISTVAFSMDQLKLIKTKLQVTISAVITGIVSLGVRLYMQGNDTGFNNSRTTALVLLNTRNINGYMSIQDMLKADNKIWGNQFAFLHVDLPKLTTNKTLNPLDFVSKAQKNILRKRNSPAVYLTGQFLEIIRKFRGPEAAAQYIKGTCKRSSLGITSLIGPVEQMACAKHPVKGLYFMPIGVHKSLVVSVMSYMGTMRIGIGTEKGYIDSQRLVCCIDTAFELIYKAATLSK
ncbi:wax ester synthase/diacylglycerol acyltransferase 7-like [Silene latifolia]|uniref:wax ester synthase/diacylglycerol acyltransferase 7-like n=1 Tax=Silene latifolia TaxID=37657 RepID=UPI003D76F736